MLKANKNQTVKTKKSAIIGSAAGLFLSVTAPSVVAEGTQVTIEGKMNNADVETIEVSGVRGSLEHALNFKKNAISIVDMISSADIDGLPALDLGEALQAIPGIQLNTDDGTRNSEINLRGLSGGFVKITAEGQSFANPSRSENEEGSSNPFGSFEASVFDGVAVVKSPTADMQEGGIAGVVDKKLQRALGKKDGQYSINVGARYEELSDHWDKEFRLSGSKHIIKDKLAVAFKVAGSEQNFRRDTANYTQYTPLVSQVTSINPKNYNILNDDLTAYKSKYGIADNAVIKAVGKAGQVTEISRGDRISATANIEYKATENLKFGANLLYTKRTLDESNQEDVQFSTRDQADYPNMSIEPIGAPIRLNDEADGTPIYAVTHVKLKNANWAPANRLMSYTEEAKGIFLYTNYIKDEWTLDGTVSFSESVNEFQNQGLDIRHTTKNGGTYTDNSDPNNIKKIAWAPTGIDVEINTANGDLSKAYTKATGFDTVDYNGTWSEVSLSGFSSRLDPLSIGGKDVTFYVNGRVDRPERTEKSVQFNAKRYVDLGFDAAKFTSVKFGVRHSNEELVNSDLRVGAGGINVSALNQDNIFKTTLFAEEQNPYFNGDFPGFYDSKGGWVTIDSRNLKTKLQTDMRQLEGAQVADPTGFFVRTDPLGYGLNQFYRKNFSVEQAISAAYFMAEFEGELGRFPYQGNAGLRHVTTKNEVFGSSILHGEPVKTKGDNDYTHNLPSINFSLELHEDIILRSAYSEALVRPNLRSQIPSSLVDDGPAKVKIEFAKSDLEPYTSKNYDLSLEWYNREGSAISVGVFKKEITGLFRDETICPIGFESSYDGVFGALESVPQPTGDPLCQEIAPYVDENGVEGVKRPVVITRTYNSTDATEVIGYELALQQKLDFLPYPWNGFGGVFNYTYVDTETKTFDPKTQTVVITPMEKIAPRSYNLIGYWENDGVSIRLAYNWQAAKLLSTGTNGGFLGSESREQTAGGRLDLSTSFQIAKNLKLNVLGYNLNNRQEYEYTGGNEDAIYRVRYSGRTYQVNLNYTF